MTGARRQTPPGDAPADATWTAPALAQAARAGFERAAAASVLRAEERVWAGATLQLRVAGDALAEAVLAPLAHLPAAPPGRPADLSVAVFDASAAGGFPVPASWADGSFAPGADLRLHDATVSITHQRTLGETSVYDRGAAIAHWCVADARALRWQQAALPFRLVMSWWAAERGLQLLHAAAVGDERGAVVLTARGGSGKSTCSLTCMLDGATGLRLVGDDFCTVDPARATVHSAYSSATLPPAALDRLPELRDVVERWPTGEGRDDKAVAGLWPAHRDRLLDAAPVVALAVPQVTSARASSFEPCSAMEVLSAVVPVSVVGVQGNGPGALARLAGLARSRPAYRLLLGSDRAGVAAAVRDLLDVARHAHDRLT